MTDRQVATYALPLYMLLYAVQSPALIPVPAHELSPPDIKPVAARELVAAVLTPVPAHELAAPNVRAVAALELPPFSGRPVTPKEAPYVVAGISPSSKEQRADIAPANTTLEPIQTGSSIATIPVQKVAHSPRSTVSSDYDPAAY